MLTLTSLTIRLSNGQLLFNGLSHAFAAEERHSIVGNNGVGKSTLLNLIAGLRSSETGSITWNKRDITHLAFYERSQRFLGFLFQQPSKGCTPLLTVRQNLQLASMKKRSFTLETTLDKALFSIALDYADLLQINMSTILDRPMMHLSGGQQQLIAFIMMLINNPELILLDEPTAALSPHAIQLLTQLLLQYHAQHKSTILCVTHDMAFSEALATQTHELQEKGAIMLKGSCV